MYEIQRISFLEWKTGKNNHRYMDVIVRYQIHHGRTDLIGFKTSKEAQDFITNYLIT